MSLLGHSYLSRAPSPLAAYNRLQAALMRIFVRRGGSPQIWIERMAPAFRQRHGWVCGEAEPVVVRIEQHRV